MVTYTQWTSIAFEIAADDVPPQRVIQRASQLWNENKAALKAMNMSEARAAGRRAL